MNQPRTEAWEWDDLSPQSLKPSRSKWQPRYSGQRGDTPEQCCTGLPGCSHKGAGIYTGMQKLGRCTGSYSEAYTEINKWVFWLKLISFQVITSSCLMLTYSSKSMPRYNYRRHTVSLLFSCPKNILEMP
uniref:Uncharacterized protein n=1 Tax=Arundo donax TaxID=35708 RepID=A0A0A9G693_ARUDO